MLSRKVFSAGPCSPQSVTDQEGKRGTGHRRADGVGHHTLYQKTAEGDKGCTIITQSLQNVTIILCQIQQSPSVNPAG